MGDTSQIKVRRARYRDWRTLALLAHDVFPYALPLPVVSYVLRDSFPLMGVAESPAGIAGFYFFCPAPDDPNAAWLNYMGVARSQRGAGVGTLLLRAFEEHARELGYQRALLAVHNDNDAAIRLYECEGFVQLGPDPEQGKIRLAKVFPNTGQPHRPPWSPSKSLASRFFRRLFYWCAVDLPLRWRKRSA